MDGAVAMMLEERQLKRVSLKEMLRWAYNSQMVDVLSGKLIDDDQHAFVVGETASDLVSHFSNLGTRVDNAGSNRFAKNDVHPDAELLHDKVLELGKIDARLVVQFGKTGMFPEPELPVAHPAPVMAGDHYKIANWRGEQRRIRLKLEEVILDEKQTWVEKGRKGVELAYTELIRTEVYSCPIVWHPDPQWCAVTIAVAEHWERVMATLRASLAGMLADAAGERFLAHELTDLA